MSIRKLGCLNSQVCSSHASVNGWTRREESEAVPHIVAIRRTVVIGLFHLVEVILVELTNERREIRVFEVKRKDVGRELVHVLRRPRGRGIRSAAHE